MLYSACVHKKGQAITSVHIHQIPLKRDYWTSFKCIFFDGISSPQRSVTFPHGHLGASLRLGNMWPTAVIKFGLHYFPLTVACILLNSIPTF